MLGGCVGVAQARVEEVEIREATLSAILDGYVKG